MALVKNIFSSSVIICCFALLKMMKFCKLTFENINPGRRDKILLIQNIHSSLHETFAIFCQRRISDVQAIERFYFIHIGLLDSVVN